MGKNWREDKLMLFQRLVAHVKTREEFEYLKDLARMLLTQEQLQLWRIAVLVEYQFSLPKEGA